MFSNALWMMQRPLAHYQGIDEDERRSVDAVLSQCDGLEAMNYVMPRRLKRSNNRLAVV